MTAGSSGSESPLRCIEKLDVEPRSSGPNLRSLSNRCRLVWNFEHHTGFPLPAPRALQDLGEALQWKTFSSRPHQRRHVEFDLRFAPWHEPLASLGRSEPKAMRGASPAEFPGLAQGFDGHAARAGPLPKERIVNIVPECLSMMKLRWGSRRIEIGHEDRDNNRFYCTPLCALDHHQFRHRTGKHCRKRLRD